MSKKKKDAGQPELPIEGVTPATPAKKSKAEKENGADHVIAETVEAIVHKPFDPKKLEVGLHTRVDRGFLDYASYVIRDRAIPNLADGLKPVQRRILWALHEKDDGRFIKVANVVGHTMQYHPHGDASIGDAVNVAARLQDMTKSVGCEAIVSEEVCTTAGFSADALPQQQVEIRGRTEPMIVRIVANTKTLSPLTDADLATA